MEEKHLKIELELNVVGDGRIFLNYWNAINGDDVIAEVKNGELYQEDNEGNKSIKISLQEFINNVKQKFE